MIIEIVTKCIFFLVERVAFVFLFQKNIYCKVPSFTKKNLCVSSVLLIFLKFFFFWLLSSRWWRRSDKSTVEKSMREQKQSKNTPISSEPPDSEPLEHEFNTKTYVRETHCDICNEILAGFARQVRI